MTHTSFHFYVGIRKFRNPLFSIVCEDCIFSITSIHSFPSLDGRGLREGCFYPFLHPHLCLPPSRGRKILINLFDISLSILYNIISKIIPKKTNLKNHLFPNTHLFMNYRNIIMLFHSLSIEI